MKYYLIAGERSGDLHASNLMKALIKKDSNAEFRYFGGEQMQAVGGELVVHYRELAFMGFWEVLTNLGTISKFLKQCKKDIDSFQPDAIILVDYAGFNLKIAKYAKSDGYKVFYYISPKVWAWNQKRALKIIDRIDHMFSILPFEVDFYKKFGWEDVTYVGNPVVEAVKQHIVDDSFISKNNIDKDSKLIAVLPGSRMQEVKKILPVVTEVIKQHPEYQFGIAAVKNLPESVYTDVASLGNTTLIIEDTYNLLARADAAIVTSGTATLETALWDVPQVVVYKSSWLSYRIAKMLVKVKWISLVNLIAEDGVVKELIQDNCNETNISEELKKIVSKGIDYGKMQSVLGDKEASKLAVNNVLKLLLEK
ncbi:MAG: lipid-A-disaccharide synthase [Bacteroidota bacterium]